MATIIQMKQPSSGVFRDGFYGFSWTTLIFGFFPALFRGDFLTFIGGFAIWCILAATTWGVGAILAMTIWAFFYNNHYTKRLLEKGYIFHASPTAIMDACNALGVSASAHLRDSAKQEQGQTEVRIPPAASITREKKSLDNDAYKIYLVKKYNIEKSEVLGKYVLQESLLDSVEDALKAAHRIEVEGEKRGTVKMKNWTVTDALHAISSAGYQIESSLSGYKLNKDRSSLHIKSDQELIAFGISVAGEMAL